MATFYLKYRPQKITDLDLESVRKQLTDILKSGNIPHAFLLSGTRGLGKTSAARILAKAINCQNKVKGEIEPCSKCEVCLAIEKGKAIDVVEMDGASNRGIDDVRVLKENINSAPLSFAKKIFVIDEVHMLTKEAFNALLKTLEEPPSHVVFILATTEPHKLPETIISRTFHVQFQRASSEEIKRSLQRVITGEKLEVEEKVLDKIIQRADGGFRDSVKMLEQLAFNSFKIDENVFAKVFPQADINVFFNFLSQKDGSKAITWITDQQNLGVDWEDVIRTILSKLRDLLLADFGILTKEEKLFNQEETKRLIQLFMQAASKLKTSLLPTLPLEIAVIDYLQGSNQINEPNTGIKNNIREILMPASSLVQDDKEESKVIEKENFEIKQEEQTKLTLESKQKEIKAEVAKNSINFTLPDLQDKWDEFLKIVRPYNFSVEALLRSSQPFNINGHEVVFKVFYEFHKNKLETEKCLQIVESAFVDLFGCKPRIRYILGEKQEKQKHEFEKDKKLEKDVEEIFN
ncbi:DNA polymerase III subunit gamma/tau [Candidatus Beckwithbacteria bacterium]|nr:DNA polymerase III subunit gamma/tau [Candidatus Beckwithbacteria bacterium]